MDIKEALQEIKGRTKAYNQLNPKMGQGTFTNTIKAIEYGFAKPNTIAEFMAKFGYSKVKQIEQWERIEKSNITHAITDERFGDQFIK